MQKKTLNIAAVCFISLLIVFTITQKQSVQKGFTDNIEIDESLGSVSGDSFVYQKEILRTVLDQNIKAFESVSESFKKKSTDTLSETISKNIFSQYIEYNTSKSLDTEVIQNETIEALKKHPVQKSTLGVQDIKMIGNSVENLKAYGNTVGMIQTELFKAIDSIKNKKNPSIYIKNLYSATADLYLKQYVPESLSKEHVGIINGYKNYSIAFGLLELQSKDPAKALSGVQLAKEAQDMLVESLVSVKRIVLLNNITYSKEELAYTWFIDESTSSQIKTK